MKLIFKERLFSWFDSYDIYDEAGMVAYTVEGKLSWGHRLLIYRDQQCIGEVKEQMMRFLSCYDLYYKGVNVGTIEKKFSFFRPQFHLHYQDWHIQGDIWEWNYEVYANDRLVMRTEKQLFQFTDTYVLDIERAEDQVLCLMIVLAIDADKCSRKS